MERDAYHDFVAIAFEPNAEEHSLQPMTPQKRTKPCDLVSLRKEGQLRRKERSGRACEPAPRLPLIELTESDCFSIGFSTTCKTQLFAKTTRVVLIHSHNETFQCTLRHDSITLAFTSSSLSTKPLTREYEREAKAKLAIIISGDAPRFSFKFSFWVQFTCRIILLARGCFGGDPMSVWSH